jgi:hypothetical protein
MRGKSSQGLTLPLRYLMHKRLKDLEVTERKQVGDAEALFNSDDGSNPVASGFYNSGSEL